MLQINNKFALVFFILICFSLPVKAQSIPWPETFRGSPEFEFNRNTLINKQNDAVKIERGVGRSSVQEQDNGSIEKLMTSSVFNLYAVLSRKVESKKENDKEASIQDDLIQIDLPNLPVFGFNPVISKQDFTKRMLEIIDDPASYQVQYDEDSLKEKLKKVVIQGINASDTPYVVIQNQKLRIGDHFPLRVKVKDSSNQIIDRINGVMPPRSDLNEKDYLEYDKIRRDMIETYKKRRDDRNKAEETNDNLHKIYVVVRKIEHRNVSLRVQGNPYSIGFDYSL